MGGLFQLGTSSSGDSLLAQLPFLLQIQIGWEMPRGLQQEEGPRLVLSSFPRLLQEQRKKRKKRPSAAGLLRTAAP